MTSPLRVDNSERGSTKKYSELVVDALSNLQDKLGTDLKHITDFVVNREKIPENEAKKMVQTTLHRGIQFGAIEKKPGGLYKLTDDFMKYTSQQSCGRRRRRRRSACSGGYRRRRRRRRRSACSGRRRRRRRRRRGASCRKGCRRRLKRGDRRKFRCRSTDKSDAEAEE